MSFPPPPPPIPDNGIPLTPQEWAKAMLDKDVFYKRIKLGNKELDLMKTKLGADISILDLGRHTIALFKNFPPEYVDYYKALQVEIAARIPEEQDRPLICLEIKGSKRIEDKSPADVGMAGGTGPLSDATALENLVRHMSEIGKAPFDEKRQEIAVAMQNFSGVMYSMPPPRDKEHAHDGASFLRLYKSARQDMPCTSLHILTNTGHSNKSYFGNDYLLGKAKFGDVDDMTIKVAHRIKVASQKRPPGERVLVLGTTDAAHKKLYPNLLSNRNLESVLPTGVFEGPDPQSYLQKAVHAVKKAYYGEEAQVYLQTIINQAKAGKVNDPMPNEERTCGQAFVDFAVHFARNSQCTALLFSCTEIPMLLHTKVSANSEQTYEDLLKEALPKTIAYYDTEKIFVDEIAKKSATLQLHPEMRSTSSLRRGGLSHYHVLHAKLDKVKEEILKYCHSFIDLDNELHLQKRNVLLATLQFFEDGNQQALDDAKARNPRYADAKLRSNTLALVTKGERLAALVAAEQEKMPSFQEMKAQLNDGRKQELANAEEKEPPVMLQAGNF